MKRLLHVLGVVCLVVITVVRFFPNLSYIPIQKWDEQTNLAIITNPLSIENFPLLYKDNKPFFEKPPLWYWATIVTNKYISNPSVSARTISALCGILTLLIITSLSWSWWGYIAGMTTWIILITTNHFFIINPAGSFSTHTLWSADLESIHILFLTISFASLTRHTKHSAIIAGISAGLSVLSKSPLGLLPLIIATYAYPADRKSRMYILSWIAAIATMLPWYLWMVSQFHLPFLASHFSYHMAARVQLPLEGHEKTIWYYAQILSERRFFLSWEWLVGSIIVIIQHRLLKDSKIKFSLYMTIATFIIPTIVSTKLAWYILPFYPFAALVIGCATTIYLRTLLRTRSYIYKGLNTY